MSGIRLVGLALILIGLITLAWGGIFWTDRDTVIDAGPLQVQTEDTEGFALPPVLGGIALVAGIVLLVMPQRRRV